MTPATGAINLRNSIGNTPIVLIEGFDTGPCKLFLKLETVNPTGSIKDHIALRMIEEVQERGELRPTSTIIEATSGNNGISLALVCLLKRLRLLLVVQEKVSVEKRNPMKALGADLRVTGSFWKGRDSDPHCQ